MKKTQKSSKNVKKVKKVHGSGAHKASRAEIGVTLPKPQKRRPKFWGPIRFRPENDNADRNVLYLERPWVLAKIDENHENIRFK